MLSLKRFGKADKQDGREAERLAGAMSLEGRSGGGGCLCEAGVRSEDLRAVERARQRVFQKEGAVVRDTALGDEQTGRGDSPPDQRDQVEAGRASAPRSLGPRRPG